MKGAIAKTIRLKKDVSNRLINENLDLYFMEMKAEFPEMKLSASKISQVKRGILIIIYSLKNSLNPNHMVSAFHTTGGCMRDSVVGEVCTDFRTIMARCYASCTEEEMKHMNSMRPQAVVFALNHGRLKIILIYLILKH